MRAYLVAVLLLLTGCAQAQPSEHALRLEFERGVCSGTAVGRDLVLTASHCFGPGARLLRINGEEAYAMRINRSGRDHALVKVTIEFTRWARVGPAMRLGDRVSWTGNPAALPDVYRVGHVAQVTGEQVLIQAPVFGGDSGAGIFNERGQLVGVVSGFRMWRDPRSGATFSLAMTFPLDRAIFEGNRDADSID